MIRKHVSKFGVQWAYMDWYGRTEILHMIREAIVFVVGHGLLHPMIVTLR